MTVTIAPYAPSFIGGAPFTGVNNDQNLMDVYFSVVCTVNYPALGDPMSFAQLGDLVKSQYAPLNVDFKSVKSGGASGFLYGYIPGNPATPFNGKFQLLTTAAVGSQPPFVDAGAIAYPGGVLSDTILGRASFLRL